MNLVHGSGHKKASKVKRKATEMHITRAKNGFSVRTHHEPTKKAEGKRGMMMGGYEPPEESVFNDPAALQAHVADKFGGPPPAAGTPPLSAAPAPGQEPS